MKTRVLSGRALAIPAVCVLAAAILLWLTAAPSTGARSAAASARARHVTRPQPLIVTPRSAQVVRSDVVRIAVHSGDRPGRLAVQLNGVQIGKDFGLSQHGLRTLQASISHGLRSGTNVLRVTVRRTGASARTATVRFVVRTGLPLVGAGIDRRIVVGERIRLDGRVVPAERGTTRPPSRWRLVKNETTAAVVSSAKLSQPGRVHAGFSALSPGRYTLRLTAERTGAMASAAVGATSAASPSTSDSVTLWAVPPNPLVDVDTMVNEGGQPGIKVDKTVYKAPEPQGRPAAFVQVLVLDRRTLGYVSNTDYVDTDQLEAALSALGPSKLVIAVLQKPAAPNAGSEPLKGKRTLAQALAPIGFPNLEPIFTLQGGDLSAIGVAKTNPGDADTNVDARGGEMNGYLAPDQWRNYGFISSKPIPFDFPKDPLTDGPATAGFKVTDYNGRTGEIRDTKLFTTNPRPLADPDRAPAATKAAKDMIAFISQIPGDDPVAIRTFSNAYDPSSGDNKWRLRPIEFATVDRATMTGLAQAVASVGGTRNGINTVVLADGPTDGVPVYALMGWSGAGEGKGQEVSLAVDKANERNPLPELSGVLRRDGRYRFRPVEVSISGRMSDKLEQLVVEPPDSEPWPLQNDPGAMRAFAYLGEQDNRLGSDPRPAYWTHEGDESEWNNIAAKIRDVRYPGKSDPDLAQRHHFTLEQFRDARDELVRELRWVGRVRGYLKDLSAPFSSGTALRGWAESQTIADQVHLSTLPPDAGVNQRWLQFTSILFKALGPFTFGATTVFSSALDFGVWLAGADPDGTSGYEAFHVKANELGKSVVDQALSAQATYSSMGDIIVSDYHKLRVIGQNGGCNPAASGCDKDFAFTKDDKAAAVAGIYRAVERLAYEKFVPLAYHVYELNTTTYPLPDPSRPPDVHKYRCGLYGGLHHTPFNPDRGFSALTSTSLQQEIDPGGRDHQWQTFVIAKAREHPQNSLYAEAPPASMLKRMFDPIPDDLNPKQGGLGISQTQLMTTAKHWGWQSENDPGTGDNCDFGG